MSATLKLWHVGFYQPGLRSSFHLVWARSAVQAQFRAANDRLLRGLIWAGHVSVRTFEVLG